MLYGRVTVATVSDIAQAAGVSASTVYRVLNGQSSKSMPEEVRLRIIAAAEKLDYQKRPRHHSIGANKVRKLAVIGMNSEARDEKIPYFQTLTQAFQRECAARGFTAQNYEFVWSDNVQSYHQFDDCDKVIVLANNEQAAEHFSRTKQDVLFVAASPDPTRFPSIRIDLASGSRLALGHLMSLGYQAIGYFGAESEVGDPLSRYATVVYELAGRGIFDERYVDVGGDWTARSGFEMAQRAVATGRVAPCYFVANDPMAIGAIRGFTSLGLNIPEDVAIVGFDNIYLSSYTQPPLTTIDHSPDVCAQLALSLVIDGLAGHVPLVQMLLPTSLVVRESCGVRLREYAD